MGQLITLLENQLDLGIVDVLSSTKTYAGTTSTLKFALLPAAVGVGAPCYILIRDDSEKGATSSDQHAGTDGWQQGNQSWNKWNKPGKGGKSDKGQKW